MYSKILVPIDTSYETDCWLKSPLHLACQMAEDSGGLVHIVSVIPRNILDSYYPDVYMEDVITETRKKLDTIVKKHIPFDTRAEVSVEEGSIGATILKAAHELEADLIVMASHGPLIKGYVLGSNAAHVTLHAPCSVFIVREGQEAA